MEYVSDLHLHSRYSRAVSQDMILPTMARYAMQKGIHILSACDWTHPLWFKEIKAQLQEAEEGVYTLKSQISNIKSQINTNNEGPNTKREPLFLLSTEIASIYKQGDKLRRIHNLVFVPSLATAEKINQELMRRGCNLTADGRPIVGLSSKQLLELILAIDEHAMLIPCHVWTPHFGVYGSASGFDSLEESFGTLSKYIYGVETGLSSDPEMNWQIPELANRSILSFSDAHSPGKMAREATVFELENPSYENMRRAIMRQKDLRSEFMVQSRTADTISTNNEHITHNRILYTIEFYPEEGKYHFSGHRNCKVVYGPEEIEKNGTTCPVCKRRLTEGVLSRVQQLSDQSLLHRAKIKQNSYGLQWYIDSKKQFPPYVKLVPLLEIIAESMESTVFSQKVKTAFVTLCDTIPEIDVLLKTSIEEIKKISGDKIAEGVARVRSGTIVIDPGYDGEYGKVKIWPDEVQRDKETKEPEKTQLGLL